MIDALLFAARDAIIGAGFGWSKNDCAIMADGHPEPRCGDWFLAIHGLSPRSEMDNALDEYFGFSLTLTARVAGVPLDRLGDKKIATNIARTQARETGFNARAEQLRAFMHMNWGVLQDANTNLVNLEPGANLVYGFCEPARYRGRNDPPDLVGGEWFAAEPEAEDVGITSELRFEDCRRLQAIATYT